VEPSFLIDENLSPQLARHLRTALGFDAVHVNEVGLNGASDAARPTGRNQTSATNRTLLRPADAVRDTDRVVLRHIRSQASKFFNTEKQGEPPRTTEKDSMALRAELDATPREAPNLASPWPSVGLPVSPG
jgi:Domain of unknown function (DUF5615)